MPEGRIVAAYGRQYLVQQHGDGQMFLCFPRGKKSDLACGDLIEFTAISTPIGTQEQSTLHTLQGVIEKTLPRRNLFRRSNDYREKLLAANIDQVVLVVATVPDFSDELLSRILIAVETEGVECLILLNKCDLTEKLAQAREKLAIFSEIGYKIVEIAANDKKNDGFLKLEQELAEKTSVLVGQSGMGKSTLVNALCEQAKAKTQEISVALGSGKHTTTNAMLYQVSAANKRASFALIDSPGLQVFGLSHIDPLELATAFREFRPFLGNCRFRNCKHLQEPNCAIQEAYANGEIHSRRFMAYQSLLSEFES